MYAPNLKIICQQHFQHEQEMYTDTFVIHLEVFPITLYPGDHIRKNTYI
jgi:hypothetical protein